MPTCATRGDPGEFQSTLEKQRKEYEKEAEKQSKFCQEKERQVCLLCVYIYRKNLCGYKLISYPTQPLLLPFSDFHDK